MPEDQENPRIQDLIRRAEQIVRDTERSLEASDDVLRGMGLDPRKVREVLREQPMTQAQRDEAQALFRKDMEDIEQQVGQEAAHLRQSTPARAGAGRRPRTMV